MDSFSNEGNGLDPQLTQYRRLAQSSGSSGNAFIFGGHHSDGKQAKRLKTWTLSTDSNGVNSYSNPPSESVFRPETRTRKIKRKRNQPVPVRRAEPTTTSKPKNSPKLYFKPTPINRFEVLPKTKPVENLQPKNDAGHSKKKTHQDFFIGSNLPGSPLILRGIKRVLEAQKNIEIHTDKDLKPSEFFDALQQPGVVYTRSHGQSANLDFRNDANGSPIKASWHEVEKLRKEGKIKANIVMASGCISAAGHRASKALGFAEFDENSKQSNFRKNSAFVGWTGGVNTMDLASIDKVFLRALSKGKTVSEAKNQVLKTLLKGGQTDSYRFTKKHLVIEGDPDARNVKLTD